MKILLFISFFYSASLFAISTESRIVFTKYIPKEEVEIVAREDDNYIMNTFKVYFLRGGEYIGEFNPKLGNSLPGSKNNMWTGISLALNSKEKALEIEKFLKGNSNKYSGFIFKFSGAVDSESKLPIISNIQLVELE